MYKSNARYTAVIGRIRIPVRLIPCAQNEKSEKEFTMKNLLSKKLGLLLPLALALTGCSSNSQNPEPSSAAVPEEMEVSESHDTGLPFDLR